MGDNEFSIIEDLFAPLSEGASGAHLLKDDAASLPSADYIVTKDVLIAGVHFRKEDPLDLVAQKVMRANLSDLAAKGARPVGYFLGCVWGVQTSRRDINSFVNGLKKDQEQFNLALFGGDTTVHTDKNAPLMFSGTFFGLPPRNGVVRRDGAGEGDDIYVTGAIGDAGLGLRALLKKERFSKPDLAHFVERYQRPEPRLTMGSAIAGFASATIDVSDGLLADLGHIVKASGPGLGARIEACKIPLSPAGQSWLERQDATDDAIAAIAAAGDDYELVFTAPSAHRRAVEMAGRAAKTPVTRIGTIVSGEGVRLLNVDNATIPVKSNGYNHFS